MQKEIINEKLSLQLKGNQRRKGKVHSVESKNQISLHNKGYHWFNNNQVEVKAKECPDGFIKGRLKREGHWYTNFIENVWALEKPEGKRWIKGRYSYTEGKKWVNDGVHNFLKEKISAEEYKAGIRYGIIRKPRVLKIEEKTPIRKINSQTIKLKKWVPDNKPEEPLKFEKLEKNVLEVTCEKLERKENCKKHVIGNDISNIRKEVNAQELLFLLANRTPSEESMALLSRLDN